MKDKISLQINLAPNDFMHARYMLKHQLVTLGDQVDEIILTIDTKRSKGRFGENWEENKDRLYKYIEDEILPYFQVKVCPVDYSAKIKQSVADFFFGTNEVPDKDFRGGPFYSYFYGLFIAKNNFVFHLDSDMFLGGRSKTWMQEAIAYFNDNKGKLFVVSPHPGPPHPQQILVDQIIIEKTIGHDYSYQLTGMSTRLFLLDKRIFYQYKIALKKPHFKNQLIALVEGNQPADLPETLMSEFMERYALKRIDFLGAVPGLWSLHPPFRTDEFYNRLPHLITQVEVGRFPKDQIGYYDMTDSVCDWESARIKIKKNRWKRLFKRFTYSFS